jgi:hypothetical protein
VDYFSKHQEKMKNPGADHFEVAKFWHDIDGLLKEGTT